MRFLQVQNKLQTKTTEQYPQQRVTLGSWSGGANTGRISAWETCDLIYPFVPLPRHVILCNAGVQSERGSLTVVGCKSAGSSRALLTCVLKVMLPI